MGFNETDDKDMFALFDQNGDDKITMVEFKAFFRNVWTSNNNYDIHALSAAPPVDVNVALESTADL